MDDEKKTTAQEIVEALFEGPGGNPSNKKYAVRYWMAIILCRYGTQKITQLSLETTLGIPKYLQRKTLHQTACGYQAPANGKLKKDYVPTTAEAIVNALSQPHELPEKNDETFSLRLFMTMAIQNWADVKRSGNNLAKVFNVLQSVISTDSRKAITPASEGYRSR